MKKVITDSGPIISFALNSMLWVMERAKEKYGIQFYITKEVKRELVDTPLESKKFKLEALQVLSLIRNGTIELLNHQEIDNISSHLLNLANTSLYARGKNLSIVHMAEITAIAAYLHYNADAVMIDERTTRYLIERPEKLRYLLSHRLHTPVTIEQKNLSELRKKTKTVKFIRSAEFMAVSFEKGILNSLLPGLPAQKEILLDALLWGMKLNGCAISEKDLEILK